MKRLTSLGLSLTLAAGIFAGQASAATYETEVISGVNLRSAPNTSASVYRLLSKGEDIHVIQKVNDYWLKVQTKDGKIGYISASSKYTNYIAGTSGKTATAKSGVNLRSAPSTSGSKIGFISKGNTVTVLEQVNAYWLKVNYNGTIGYASANYFNYSSSSGSNSGTASKSASAIVNTAKSYLGKFAYKYGAEPWNTNYKYSDCSAFVQLVYNRHHGFKLPRTSSAQSKQGKYVSKSNLAPGDLVFFDTDGNGSINHVGIYIGGGDFIHSSPVNKVGINTLNSGYWKSKYKTARRVL
ncbi:MAG: hypothetical protein C6W55_00225 [Thermobacillus sp.]|uniref:C40 family peptidase n=1 Tax=Thermobacillus sp. TaxID=2108467 RepID=UPI000E3AAE49|nr:SH3 domain-containing C40 family peptidase [Thermobacillus sp.]REK60042.1 MAG: hypothetical protein C6W55_00225 [Thermobacillus sp.]